MKTKSNLSPSIKKAMEEVREENRRYAFHPTEEQLADPMWMARMVYALLTLVEKVLDDPNRPSKMACRAHKLLTDACCHALMHMSLGNYSIEERNLVLVAIKRGIELDIRYGWEHFGSYGPIGRTSGIEIPCTTKALDDIDTLLNKKVKIANFKRKGGK